VSKHDFFGVGVKSTAFAPTSIRSVA